MVVVREAVEQADVKTVKRLFAEYAASLGFDLCFQSFEQELAEMPGKYAPPRGCLLLADVDGVPAGCVGLRPLGGDACEMKRLYLKPECRGSGAGRMLVDEAIRRARAMGYPAMRLDTLPAMKAAIGMYRSLGFREIAPYYYNPVEGALFLELSLLD